MNNQRQSASTKGLNGNASRLSMRVYQTLRRNFKEKNIFRWQGIIHSRHNYTIDAPFIRVNSINVKFNYYTTSNNAAFHELLIRSRKNTVVVYVRKDAKDHKHSSIYSLSILEKAFFNAGEIKLDVIKKGSVFTFKRDALQIFKIATNKTYLASSITFSITNTKSFTTHP